MFYGVLLLVSYIRNSKAFIQEGKKGRGWQRIIDMSQIKEQVAVMSYKEAKEAALEREKMEKAM